MAVGLAAALVLTRAMRSLLFEVGAAIDPLTFLCGARRCCSLAALAACYLPARRAASGRPGDVAAKRVASRREGVSAMRASGILVVLLFAGYRRAWAAAQGLGDAAARERQKRQAGAREAVPAKVFTQDDLTEGRSAGRRARPAAGR